jgi:Ca-activated chloride channel family protein
MPNLQLAHPWALLLLVTVPLIAWVASREHRRAPTLRLPSARPFLVGGARRGVAARIWWLPHALAALAASGAAVALARPQIRGAAARDVSVEGIDIVIALDVSTSMLAADFKPRDRLFVAKEVFKQFVQSRTNDRMGLVVFAADAYTQCPLTLDYGVLLDVLEAVQTGVIEDGTAIGNAVATATNRLRGSEAKSKVIILLTDGDNNSGQISPVQAAEMAHEMGVKLFPIMVGKGGEVPYPAGVNMFGQQTYRNVEIAVNPELLKQMAKIADGEFYLATDRASLEGNLRDILDRLEKTRLYEGGSLARVTEAFGYALAPAFIAACLQMLLLVTRFRRFP